MCGYWNGWRGVVSRKCDLLIVLSHLARAKTTKTFAYLCRLKVSCIGDFLLRPELLTTRQPTGEFYNQSPRLQTTVVMNVHPSNSTWLLRQELCWKVSGQKKPLKRLFQAHGQLKTKVLHSVTYSPNCRSDLVLGELSVRLLRLYS